MNDESKIFGISVRAFIAILITVTLCTMSVFGAKIVEPFYSVCLFVIGFFFGQKSISLMSPTNGNGNAKG